MEIGVSEPQANWGSKAAQGHRLDGPERAAHALARVGRGTGAGRVARCQRQGPKVCPLRVKLVMLVMFYSVST
jgi:hypothetical protein